MTKNTQALILFFASQLSWMVCCAASAPAFMATTYEPTAMQWLLMLNGIAIVGSGTFLMLLAFLVKMRKDDELSKDRLDPKFSIGMGVTVFMLIAQVILSVSHAAVQPDESGFVAPQPDAVPLFQVWTTLDTGEEVGGAYGFVIAHPADQRPVFVTVSQQFGTAYGLDVDLSNDEVIRRVKRAELISVTSPDTTFTIGAPIDFDADAFLASGRGMDDPMSDVMFFEAQNMKNAIAPTKVFDGLDKAPDGQKLWAVSNEAAGTLELTFSYDVDEVWEVNAPMDADIVAGTPVLDFKHRVVGFVTRVNGDSLDVFPMHVVYDYLGKPVR